jgi:hypothetical protein
LNALVTPQKELVLEKDCYSYDNQVWKAITSAYQFEPISWKALNSNIDDFIEELKTHGPLVMMGAFGKNQYAESPTIDVSIQDRVALAWNKEAKPAKETIGKVLAHVVVVVGAKKFKKSNLVFFKDPDDGSSQTKDPLYAMSFRKLAQDSLLFSESRSYGYYYKNFFKKI